MGLKKKNKRQESTLLSPSSSFRSSSHRKQDSVSPATSKTTNVGCMSGIIQFIARYHTRRKFLTFGNKKQERNGSIHSPTEPPPGKSDQQLKPEKTVTCQPCDHNSTVLDKLSPDHAPPRTATILPELQRSSTNKTVNPPRVLERLMGLDDFPAIIPAAAVMKGMSPAYEKRRKLLWDLEKCDEDLKALKKIIETVRAEQTPPRMVKMERRVEVEEVESEVGSEGPSPVSVLDHRHLSSGYSKKIIPTFATTTKDKATIVH
ncbi:uncharacterized protein LOC130826070 isoform X2 [Amaranthus tricolor]|uniref:uncharacterized protein LOC130826070 isoform X2 n=1 Tax=Amaranthus tricolor TaxID=29722 RepID=UPI00258CBA2B|nr:uncharacterized protein LOC130826070 isoform X2 [Amaranthus tricolor]